MFVSFGVSPAEPSLWPSVGEPASPTPSPRATIGQMRACVVCGRVHRVEGCRTSMCQAQRMLSVPQPPTREEVEARFVALLNGSQSRGQVDRWAAPWVTHPDAGGVDGEDVWWALTLLYGVTTTSRYATGSNNSAHAADEETTALATGPHLAAKEDVGGGLGRASCRVGILTW